MLTLQVLSLQSQNIDSLKVVIFTISAESVGQTTREGKAEYHVLQPLVEQFDYNFDKIVQQLGLEQYFDTFINSTELPIHLREAAIRLKCKICLICPDE